MDEVRANWRIRLRHKTMNRNLLAGLFIIWAWFMLCTLGMMSTFSPLSWTDLKLYENVMLLFTIAIIFVGHIMMIVNRIVMNRDIIPS